MDKKNIKNITVSVNVHGRLPDGTRTFFAPKESFVSLEEALTFLVEFKSEPTL